MAESPSTNREAWGSWLQFLFSAIGSLVGYGNIWRFPYICYRNGGGAFLIPFCLCMAMLGIPIGFIEILYCQYSNLGPGRVWMVSPLFRGVWFGMIIMTFVVSLYYTMLMAWVLYFLGVSFSPSLPWSSCGNDWNTPNCVTHAFNTSRAAVTTSTSTSNITRGVFTTLASNMTRGLNKTLSSNGTSDLAGIVDFNKALNKSLNSSAMPAQVSSQEEYWIHQVLGRSSGIEDIGNFRWELVICLFVAWVVVFVCLAKGVQVMGKIAYIAATLPYIILTVLLVRSLFLPGSTNGIYYFFYPEWTRLGDYTVWRDAATQLFFSAGLGFGVLSTLASYNKFHNNCFRDAMLMPILDTITSVFAGVIIFSFIGYMAHLAQTGVEDVVEEGPGLVFIAYPMALETLPLPQLWSVLFFLMLFCTGLDSQICHIQMVATALMDLAPGFRSKRTKIIGVLCCLSFLLGLPLTTQAGEYILNLVDWYLASISLMLIVFVELMVLAWIYGTERLHDNIVHMIGYRVPGVFSFAWKYFTPLCVLVLWASGIVGFRPIGSKYPGYTTWSDGLGFVIALLPILPIPVCAVWTLYYMEGPMRERISKSVRPTGDWKPAESADTLEDECFIKDTKELEML